MEKGSEYRYLEIITKCPKRDSYTIKYDIIVLIETVT